MVKHIFFDFNGTILDDTDLCFDIEEKMLKKHGLYLVSKDFYLDNFCFPVKKYYEKVGFDFNKLDYGEISEEFMSEYFLRYKNETKLYDGIEYLLGKLKSTGFKLYVLSATEEKALNKQLKELGIHMFFDGIIGTRDNFAKGKIEFAKDFISKNNIDNAIFIGDTIHDYEVGKELGFDTVLVDFGHNSHKLLQTVSTNIVSSYQEIYELLTK